LPEPVWYIKRSKEKHHSQDHISEVSPEIKIVSPNGVERLIDTHRRDHDESKNTEPKDCKRKHIIYRATTHKPFQIKKLRYKNTERSEKTET
jgi:hypothetical protein